MATGATPAGNVADLVRRAAGSHPQRVALIAGEESLTWADLDAAVDRLVAGIASHGVARGDRVVLLAGNSPEYVTAYFAILRLGAVAVPLNPASTAAETGVLVVEAGARLVLCQRRTADLAEAVVAGADGVAVARLDDPAQWPATDAVTAPRTVEQLTAAGPAGGDDLAVVLFTAGTAGRPKGAMLTHGALLANVEALLALTDPPAATGDDVLLVVLPLFHIYGLNAVLGPAAASAATCVLLDRFDPVEALRIIADRRVTTVAGAPPMYRAWAAIPTARESLAGVRLLTSGGAALPKQTYDAFVEATGQQVWEGYGMTETGPVVASTLASHRPRRGSVGRPLPGWEVRLVEAGDDVDDGDPGEVWVRGPSLFAGYWPDGAGGPDADGWFNTGDVAYVDDDGDLRLVDRRREVILVSGFAVYPREVEQVVESLPGVAECAVVGIPDARTGEAVAAFVVLREASGPSADEIAAHCAGRLARFKRPAQVTLVESLPHSATGRIAKGRLREVHGV